ncbi:MAG: hypothetical protein ACYDEQ_01895 [Desulfocucumaceae bacterium]
MVIKFILLGDVTRSDEIRNAIEGANIIQNYLQFIEHDKEIKFNIAEYKLPNKGYNLDALVDDLISNNMLIGPLVFITSLPYGTKAKGNNKNYFYFTSEDVNRKTSIISTYLWNKLKTGKSLERYITLGLANCLLSTYSGLTYHKAIKRCIFDYCDIPKTILKIFEGEGYCKGCLKKLQSRIRNNEVNSDLIVACTRLINEALNHKKCFVAMPFDEKYDQVKQAIKSAVNTRRWFTERGDEMEYPLRISDAIELSIKSSNLVIADVTDNNPNVFYEVGYAHGVGIDVLLITQNKELPFDLKMERAIYYKNDALGQTRLIKEIKRFLA